MLVTTPTLARREDVQIEISLKRRHCERSVAIPYLQSGSAYWGLPRYARNDVMGE